jgi:SAM-dependent methyltransferase
MPGAVTRTACAVTRTACAVTRFTAVTRHVIFERVFDLLAGVFEVGLRLVGLAVIFSALVAGDLADRFFGLTDKVLDLVLRLIRTAHGICSYFTGIGSGLPNVYTVGTSRASRQNVRDLADDGLAAMISIIEAAYDADLRRLHDEVASFDVAHARTVLVNVPDPEAVLAEMTRLVRAGGSPDSIRPPPDKTHLKRSPA